MRFRTWIVLVVLLAALGASVSWPASSPAATDIARGAAATPAQQVQQARAGTLKFKSVAAAKKAGYRQSAPCIPGKGIHFRSMKVYNEPGVHPARPEMLLYEPTAKGLVLVGVEYELPDGDQRAGTTKDRPKLFGVKFDGPLDAHPTGPQKLHYHLHVWLWKKSPDGMVTEINTAVKC
jgi:hypothetical protein